MGVTKARKHVMSKKRKTRGLTLNATQRAAYKYGGVKRMTRKANRRAAHELTEMIKIIVECAINIKECGKRARITPGDIKMACEAKYGRKVYGFGYKKKKKKTKINKKETE